MKPIKQYIKTKKSEIKENIFQDISCLELNTNLTKNQSEILLKENFYDVEIIEFEKLFNISKKMLYTSNITSLMMILTKVIRIEPPNY